MSKLTLRLTPDVMAIHSLPANSAIPEQVFSAPLYFLAKTHQEVSIVLPSNIEIDSDDVEDDWRMFEVIGPLAFSLTGILSNISTVLANEKISIFAISTFDTDHILVKSNKIAQAKTALLANGYDII
ncbi:ACT domain-containing protein [Thalassotalea sp. LPB0316]|uniref:ACT domain-containing protein n=1 Tax=Thalassotalea sp. LPB0316 TaxID=2769490 RepID=UPI0018665C2C|nr:ACT domain-containing protein [Thalassotalea sp. LPB0316]QOL25172.1 ACT domain-containing protein [Thalassotalea sp. LPB0316]